jgi:hypothetical protein
MNLDNITVTVTRMGPDVKCPRCYKYDVMVGSVKDYPEVCPRCAEALRAMGFTMEIIASGEWHLDIATGKAVRNKP